MVESHETLWETSRNGDRTLEKKGLLTGLGSVANGLRINTETALAGCHVDLGDCVALGEFPWQTSNSDWL